jgi:oxysterol-binding protein-related protein 1/2
LFAGRPDLGIRVVCEQVSHHPPVSAFHVESAEFTFSGAVNPKIKFWGKSVEVTPRGIVTLVLKRYIADKRNWSCNCHIAYSASNGRHSVYFTG